MSKLFFRFYAHMAVYLGCCVLLISCAPPKVPDNPNNALLNALLSDNPNAIQQQLNQSDTTVDSSQLIELYNLVLRDRHHQIADQSKILLKRYGNLSNSQKKIAKEIISWAYIRKIYRQETARQVRIYQREELLVAPSDIDFKSCEQTGKHCANALRERLYPLISADQLTEILLQMAAKDPCINLSNEDRAGEFASNCLATRKGNLKLVLLSPPQFTRMEWQSIL
ncbi:hypothetical protein [Marinicella sp. W31]|uniref:hypothetical protein n=1 Tax=Marinicella sp. W31 TaxID=3023713 RepID=UPI003756FA7C